GDRFGLLNSDGVTQGTIDKVHDVFNFNSRKPLYAEGAALQKPMLFINGEMWIAEETGIGILPVGADTYSQVIQLDPVLGRPATLIYDDVRGVVLGGYLNNFFAIAADTKNMLCNDPFPNIGMWGPLWRTLVYNKTDQHCYYKTTSAAGGGDICVTSLANYNSPNFSDTFTHSVDVYNMEIFDSGVLAFTDANKVIHFGKMGTDAVFQQIEQASYPAGTSDQGFQLYGGNFMLIYQFNRGDYSVWRFTDIQPPINVGAYALSHLAIKVHWEDPNGNTLYFEIERRLYPAGTWELAGTAASDVLEFVDSGLQPATEYEYRVIAFSDLGPSNPSTTALAQTGPTGNLDMLPYPNPTSGTITLEGCADSGRIYLYSPDGSCFGDWGTTAESFTFDIREISDTELLSGKYFLIYKASEQAGSEEMLIYYVRPDDFGGSK
ncbi:fibronectin type III domain-containing protein, partial [bacterium]|nr:fibronectin type III domain-containing protein [bacterium]